MLVVFLSHEHFVDDAFVMNQCPYGEASQLRVLGDIQVGVMWVLVNIPVEVICLGGICLEGIGLGVAVICETVC